MRSLSSLTLPTRGYTQEIMSLYTKTVIDDVTQDLMKQKGISEDTARTLLPITAAYQIYSCLDADIQASVDAVRRPLGDTADGVRRPAASKRDSHNGSVRGRSAGALRRRRREDDNPASTAPTGPTAPPVPSIKPIASYGPAVDLGLITPDTLVKRLAEHHLKGKSWYRITTATRIYGLITIYTALQYSLNTVAAQIVDKLPWGRTSMITSDDTPRRVTSLVRRTATMRPWRWASRPTALFTVREMAQAYCPFVNDGIFTYSPHLLVTDKDGNVVIDNAPSTIQAFQAKHRLP